MNKEYLNNQKIANNYLKNHFNRAWGKTYD